MPYQNYTIEQILSMGLTTEGKAMIIATYYPESLINWLNKTEAEGGASGWFASQPLVVPGLKRIGQVYVVTDETGIMAQSVVSSEYAQNYITQQTTGEFPTQPSTWAEQGATQVSPNFAQLPDGTYINQNGEPVSEALVLADQEQFGMAPSGAAEVAYQLEIQDPTTGEIFMVSYDDYGNEITRVSTGTFGTVGPAGGMTAYQQAQLGLSQQQLAAEQAWRQQQLAMEQRNYLADLMANPASWLEYSLASGQPAVVQPWMLPLVPEQYGLQAGQTIPGWPSGATSQIPAWTGGTTPTTTTPTTTTPTPATPTPTPTTTPPTIEAAAGTPGGAMTGGTPQTTYPSYMSTPTEAGWYNKPESVNNWLAQQQAAGGYIQTQPITGVGEGGETFTQPPPTGAEIQSALAQNAYAQQNTAQLQQVYQAAYDQAMNSRPDLAGVSMYDENGNVTSQGIELINLRQQAERAGREAQNAFNAANQDVMRAARVSGVPSYTPETMTPEALQQAATNIGTSPAGFNPNPLNITNQALAQRQATLDYYLNQAATEGGTTPPTTTTPTTTSSTGLFNVPTPSSLYEAAQNQLAQAGQQGQSGGTTGGTTTATTGTGGGTTYTPTAFTTPAYGSVPYWQPQSLSGLPELTRPSRQYQARMGPTALQQYYGYRQARTGIPAEETQWRLWSVAPPGGGAMSLYRAR